MRGRMLSVIALLTLSVPWCWAQSNISSGDITGFIADPSGAVIPSAAVTVIDPEKGLRWPATTDDNGQFPFLSIPAGTYNVLVQAPGFSEQTLRNVQLLIGQTAFVRIALTPGALQQEVDVSSEQPLVDSKHSQQSNTIAEPYIRELPIDRRDY